MTLVLLVTSAAADSGSMLPVSSWVSANSTVAPSAMAVAAVATKVSGDVMTSSPFVTPSAAYAQCKAEDPEFTTVASGVPASAEMAASNSVTTGPMVSQSVRITSATAAMSSSEMDWRP